jgi:hypothetical protein
MEKNTSIITVQADIQLIHVNATVVNFYADVQTRDKLFVETILDDTNDHLHPLCTWVSECQFATLRGLLRLRHETFCFQHLGGVSWSYCHGQVFKDATSPHQKCTWTQKCRQCMLSQVPWTLLPAALHTRLTQRLKVALHTKLTQRLKVRHSNHGTTFIRHSRGWETSLPKASSAQRLVSRRRSV